MINFFINLIGNIALTTECIAGSSEVCDLPNVPTTAATGTQVNQIISIVLVIVGAIALLMMVIAGISLITSEGNPQKVANARKTIIFAAIGAVIAASALIIVNFVLGSVKK